MDRDDSHAPPQVSATSDSGSQQPRGSRREIAAWAMYDWANSAYSALSITVVMIYLKLVVFPEADWGNLSGAVYPASLSISMLCAAILSPVLGAMADARATKRWWLAGTALSGALCAIAMALVPPDNPWVVLLLFALTSFFFELSYGFYNAFLPELANEETMDSVSAWGFGAGYVGGGVALGLQLLIFALGDKVGLVDDTLKLRFGLFLMGAWWAIFTLPAIVVLRDKSTPRKKHASLMASGVHAFREVRTTLGNIRGYRMLAWFLLGYLFYNDCVQTVISQASQLGEEIGFTASELVLVILMIQFMALPGAGDRLPLAPPRSEDHASLLSGGMDHPALCGLVHRCQVAILAAWRRRGPRHGRSPIGKPRDYGHDDSAVENGRVLWVL